MIRQNGFSMPLAIIILATIVVAGGFFASKKDTQIPETFPDAYIEGGDANMAPLINAEKTYKNLVDEPLPRVVEERREPVPVKNLPPAPQKIDEPKSASYSKKEESPAPMPASFLPPPSAPANRQSPEFPTQAESAQIPACAGQEFVTTPIDSQKIISISPLGNLAPPGHTFPTEHMFFHITAGNATTETVSLRAPADVYLTLISIGHGFTQDPVDYTIYFALCKDVFGYYNHVKELSPELEKLVSETPCMFSGESKDKQCNIQALSRVTNGAEIGRVGRLQGNFDLGLIDFRKRLTFANPERYGARSLYIQCALDYYNAVGKTTLYSKLERSDGKCGRVDQDVPGTLKGNWFYGSARADMGGDWDKYLAFADDNKNPALSVISIGGIIGPAEKWEFTSESSGTKNRAFNDVKPDGQVYCYEASGKSGRIILELTSAMELKIEKQNESCGSNRAFVNPTTYKR